MRHSNRRRSRARGASVRSDVDRDSFEQALLGRSHEGPGGFDAAGDRKTLQLCKQVERALSLALAGERDDVLRDLMIDAVEPMGSASQLLVRVLVPASLEVPVIEIITRLDEASTRLRVEVAQSICRKRTPTLSFIAVPMGRTAAGPRGTHDAPEGGTDVE